MCETKRITIIGTFIHCLSCSNFGLAKRLYRDVVGLAQAYDERHGVQDAVIYSQAIFSLSTGCAVVSIPNEK